MEDPGGAEGSRHGGWVFKFQGPEGSAYKLEETMEHEALLLGRVTYQGFAAAWPSMTDEVGFAEKMNSMPKYVVSRTLQELEWNNSSLISGDVPEEIAELKRSEGGDILVAGSATLVQTLMSAGLVDEYRLMVFPIILGEGRRLFGESEEAIALELVDVRSLPSGTMILTYHPG
jgi:dihydrofolate reductase